LKSFSDFVPSPLVTVRALACFISDFGLLRRKRLDACYTAYEHWSEQKRDKLEELESKWVKDGHLLQNIEIETCAVWDTVRSLHLQPNTLAFVENRVPDRTAHAFQALSLHETRLRFMPVLWSHPTSEQRRTNIRQTWFMGNHTDVGGGNLDAGLASISLLWMVAQFREFTNVAFDEESILDEMTPRFTHSKKREYFSVDHIYTWGKCFAHSFSAELRCK
jgi:uncharacterized protein (DUF2235 family)